MTRSQLVLSVLVAALLLAAVAYLAPPEAPMIAAASETQPVTQSDDAEWLPEGLELKQPEMAYGVEGVMRDLNVELCKDVQPADNAAVLLVQVVGEDVFDSVLRGACLDMLGIRRLADAPRMQYIPAFVQAHREPGTDAGVEADRMAGALMMCSERPWTREQYPDLAEYLEGNADALDLVVAAADRPRYYAPLLSLEEPMRLLSASFSIEFRMPYLARCLTARALNRLVEGDFAAGATDLAACHKLGVLLASGSPMDISCAKAHVVDAFPSHAVMALIRSGELDPQQASQLLAVLKAAPEMPTSEVAADVGERAILHEELELLRDDEASRDGYFETGPPENRQALEAIVKQPALYELMIAAADAQQDKMVHALGIRSHAEQYPEFKKLDDEFTEWNSSEEESAVPFAVLAAANPKGAAESVGLSMAMALRTNPWQRRHTDDRAQHRRDAAQIGLALVAYRGAHGEYPAELTDLAPDFLDEVPNDAFSDAPFIYEQRTPEHAVLTSFGANQRDDAGALLNDDLIVEFK